MKSFPRKDHRDKEISIHQRLGKPTPMQNIYENVVRTHHMGENCIEYNFLMGRGFQV